LATKQPADILSFKERNIRKRWYWASSGADKIAQRHLLQKWRRV
jgi:hypothetical protein